MKEFSRFSKVACPTHCGRGKPTEERHTMTAQVRPGVFDQAEPISADTAKMLDLQDRLSVIAHLAEAITMLHDVEPQASAVAGQIAALARAD